MRAPRMLAGLFTLVATSLTPPLSRIRQTPEPVGCYRFDRPLGHSATGALEQRDSTWFSVRLFSAGAVARPELTSPYWRDLYAARSTWKTAHDTLFIRVFTGLDGWDVALDLRDSVHTGTATYVTDARGGAPFIAVIHARRVTCPSDRPPGGL